MKNLVLVLGLLVSFNVNAADSLMFGPKGANTSSQVHVFIDKAAPAYKCKCARFSFMVDDITGAVGGTIIDKVVIWGTDKSDYSSLEGHVLTGLTEVDATVWTSPRVSEQVVYNINTKASDMEFKFIAMRRKCLNPTAAACGEYEIVTQGTFTAADVMGLSSVSADKIK